MKILILSNCDLLASQGSGYVITGFAQGLRDLGWEVMAVGPQDLMIVPGLSSARQMRLALGIWLKGRKLIKQFQPDVIEFYGGPAWLATLLLSIRPRRPPLIAAHSNGLEPFVRESLMEMGVHGTLDGRPPKLHQRIASHLNQTVYAFTKADVIVTVCERERKYALERGYQPEDRVLALDNALPDEFLGQPAIANDTKTIGFCGSWIVRKGINFMVPALITILCEAPGWNVQLVGVGKKFRVEEHFPEDVAGRIIVEPFVDDKARLRHIYRSWAIALMPSLYESFGLVAAEAMASGCALVATNTGFAAGLKNNVEACIVAPNSSALADGLRGLINDPKRRQEIALAGHRRVQHLRWADNIRRLHEFYATQLQRLVKANGSN